MNNSTMLLRQIHPTFIQGARVSSMAFTPFPKDEAKLSVYDGDQIEPAAAFRHYTKDLSLRSAGVFGVTVAECQVIGLPVLPDPAPFPEHALIDFSEKDKKGIKSCAESLRDTANARGWLYSDA